MTYQAIIFDFFDVIHEDPLQTWLNRHGYKKEGEFAAAAREFDLGNIDAATYVQRLAAASGQTPAQLEASFAASTALDKAVVALIGKLKQHYRLGLLSNAQTNELRPLLNRHDLVPLFDHIVISAEVQMAKPDPDIFYEILNRLQTKPAHAIFIDDNPKNIAAAQALGITGLHFQHITPLTKQLADLGIVF